ncbi:hypothetical protein OSTOST_10002 [Ostertagia ostertagi]
MLNKLRIRIREVGEEPMVVELERPGAEHPEEVEEAADEVQEENVVDVQGEARIPNPHPTFQQQVIYGAAFKLHFGMNKSIKKMMHDARQRFGHTKFFYCNPCDSRLSGSKAVCVNPECANPRVGPQIDQLYSF